LLHAWRTSGNDENRSAYLAYSKARTEYHKAVRFVKKHAQSLRLESTASSLARAPSQKEFWKRLKKSFPLRKKTPVDIEGMSSSDPKLADKFAGKYEEIFQKYEPTADKDILHSLLSSKSSSVKSDCWNQINVSKAISMLSLDKCTSDGIPPDVFANCGPSLSYHLSLLFRACEAHGYLPPEIAQGTVHQVPKANKDPSKIGSYRPITIGSVVAKIFEACVLIEYKDQLQSSSKQFGFKSGSNTAHCSLTVKGVAKHFIKGGSRVFAAFLDATEAFDRANYYKILNRLLLKGIPKSVVRILLTWYESTNIRVAFEGSMSEMSFGINHGVRQGGLLSPVLFTVGLLDDLLAELEISGVGCRIHFEYFGALAYADDIVLLAPTVKGLNHLLGICSDWSAINNIVFNPTKSFVICFASKSNRWPSGTPIPVFLNERLIPTVSTVTHLGHVLTEDLNDSAELFRIARAFNKQFHAFHCRFNGIQNVQLLKHIFNSFCSSFYGIEGIDPSCVSGSAVRFMRKSVNIALMKMLRLPRESVSPFLIAKGILNANSLMKFRSLLFWRSLMASDHPLKRFLLMSHSSIIYNVAHQLKIVPLALTALSRQFIEDIVINAWMADKGLI
jgi:hypothetical protein